jgi:DNA-binding NtrC family response regulator
MPHLLVVNEVPGPHGDLESMLQAACVRVSTVDGIPEAAWCASDQAADLTLVFVTVANADELRRIDALRANLPRVPIVVVATSGQPDVALEAMKRGAFDYLTAPLERSRVHAVVGRAVELAQLARASGTNRAAVASRNGADTAAGNGATVGRGLTNGSGGSTSTNVDGSPLNPLLSSSTTLDVHHGPGLLALEQLARDLLRTEPGSAYRRLTALVDEAAVQEALNCAKGNQLQAAALLGISRTTLRAKLRAMGLSVSKHVYLNRTSD